MKKARWSSTLTLPASTAAREGLSERVVPLTNLLASEVFLRLVGGGDISLDRLAGPSIEGLQEASNLSSSVQSTMTENYDVKRHIRCDGMEKRC